MARRSDDVADGTGQVWPLKLSITVALRDPIGFLRRNQAVAIGGFAQALQYGAALLLLPFIITRLTAAEVGIWYIFVAVQGLAQLADFGFAPAISRAVASAFAGSTRVHAEGLDKFEEKRDPNYTLIGQILRASRHLYLSMAAIVLLLLLTVGTFYITAVAADDVADLAQVRTAWIVFAASAALWLYIAWISPLLIGANRVSQNYMFIIASRGSFALFGIVTLAAGGGLLALAACNLAANIFAWLIGMALTRAVLRPVRALGAWRGSVRAVLRALWPNAGRMGLVSVAGFFITRTNLLVLSVFVGLEASASYAISFQILFAMGMITMLPTQVALPQIVGMRVRDDRAGLRSLLAGRVLFYFAAFSAGAIVLIWIGQPLFRLMDSNVQLLSRPLLALMAVVVLLELNHSNCAFIITTGNRVPFVLPALLSAAAIIIFSTTAAWAGLGILGVILAQGLVQLAYNNWKWPLVVWRELRDERS